MGFEPALNLQPLQQALNERQKSGLYRELSDYSHLIDFCSNDYLGLAKESFINPNYPQNNPKGATGSRLISGNRERVELLEQSIAHFHHAEAGLFFNSGYDANLGLLSSLSKVYPTIIADELVHASIHDGIRLGKAKSRFFKHNDLNDLKRIISEAPQPAIVVVESIYSMDGDEAPLTEILKICNDFKAALVVDEAHATGLYGENGEGLIVESGLENSVFARTITFGKAIGRHGAIVVGSKDLRSYLINFARSFIFTTALPFSAWEEVKSCYDILSYQHHKRLAISSLTNLFKHLLTASNRTKLIPSKSQIQSLIVPGNDAAKAISQQLLEAGIYAKAILSPTVPAGKERIRICFHSDNTEAEVRLLAKTLNDHLE